MKKADMMSGLFLLILGGTAMVTGWQMPQAAEYGPGAGFFPFWIGVVIVVEAVILMAGARIREATEKDGKTSFLTAKELTLAALVLVGLAAYIILLDILGYLADTFLFAAFFLGVVMRVKVLTTALVAAATAVGLYVIFQILLKVTLPSNMFGF